MDDNILNEIRSKIDIVDLISEYVPLVQKGKNYFGVCPFHNDTNPSMSVSREKQIYKCFSCGASGNIFTFVSNYENISFKEALEQLGKRVGYNISSTKSKTNSNYDKYYEIYDLSCKYYQNNINSAKGKKAKEYLLSRGLDENIIKEYGIGLSLEGNNSLTNLLLKKNYSIKDLVDIGLSSDNHDIYINRIMFPLHDINGKVVGFSGRIYDNSKNNKYLNTKETPIFKKGHCLYNYHIAKEEARKEKFVIIMEGFMDVIRASTIGYKNVVALMGTALTTDQIALIKKLSLNIILCFDGDSAGYHATMSVGNELQKIGINPKVIGLNNNDDPDSFILKNGKEKFDNLVESAINFTDFKLNDLKNGVNFNSDIELSNYIDKVIKETSLIKDEIRREIILKKLAFEVNIGYNTLEKRLNEYLSNNATNTNKIVEKKKDFITKYEKASYELIYLMMNDTDVIERFKKENIFFTIPELRYLTNEIIYFYEKYSTISIADMYSCLALKEELLALVNKIVNYCDENVLKNALDDYIKVIKEYNEGQEIKRLNDLIKRENDPIVKAKILEQIRLIKIRE